MTRDEQIFNTLVGGATAFPAADATLLALQITAWARLSRLGQLPADLSLSSQRELSPNAQADNFRRVQPLISPQLGHTLAKTEPTLSQPLPRLIEQAMRLEEQGQLREWNADDVLYWSSDRNLAHSAYDPSLARFLVSLATSDSPAQVYLPWENSGQLAARCIRKNIDCWTESSAPVAAELVLAQLNGARPDVHRNDPVLMPTLTEQGQLKTFPVSLCILEHGRRYTATDVEHDPHARFPEKTQSSMVLNLRHLLAQTSGKIIAVVPNSVLFNAGAERLLRADLLQKRMIHSVIALPGGLFAGSAAASVLILDTVNPSDTIRFVKVTDEFTASGPKKRTELVRLPELLRTVRDRDNNAMAVKMAVNDIPRDECNLEVSRYLLGEQAHKLDVLLATQPTTKLLDHFDIVRARQYATTLQGVPVQEIQAADLPDFGHVQRASKDSLFDLRTPKALSYFVERDDVLICMKGAAGKVGLVKSAPDSGAGGWVAGQSLAILRARSPGQYDPGALMVYLRSPMGQAQLSRLVVGSSTPTLQGSALKVMEIPALNIVQQGMASEALAEEAAVQSEIDRLRQKQSQIASALWAL
ncbi:N-6 DNA methylase [Pseudomonas sp. Pse1]|uniref:N-6 DNA methylase n=1 Tax=Pseudomonas sp. Pse1 TaxID=2926020 RepID=UPI002117552B|nr:N-6 DNA methylase [Pseudomonas sp. Pse1]